MAVLLLLALLVPLACGQSSPEPAGTSPAGGSTPGGTGTPGEVGGSTPEGVVSPAPGGASPAPGGASPAPGGASPKPGGGGNATFGDAEPGVATKTYVVCVKKDEGQELPSSAFLTKANGKSKKIPGTWMVYDCKYGSLDVFKIDQATFDEITKACKEKGFEHPQPGDDLHPSSYPFQVGNTITEYYRHRTPFTFSHNPPTPLDRCVDQTGDEDRRR